MIQKNFKFVTVLAISLFVAQNAQAKEASLPKIKPFFPMIVKALDIAADKTEAVLLFEFFDSLSAAFEADPRPCAKKMAPIAAKIAAIIKTPAKYTQEEKEKALEDLFELADSMSSDDKIVRFNDKAALEKTAEILVNHGWSLPGQHLIHIFMIQRLAFEGLVAEFGDKNSTLFKEIKVANEVIKRAHSNSVKEVTDALIVLETNTPTLCTEIVKGIENRDKTFTVNRDFKEYQVCALYMPQPA